MNNFDALAFVKYSLDHGFMLEVVGFGDGKKKWELFDLKNVKCLCVCGLCKYLASYNVL